MTQHHRADVQAYAVAKPPKNRKIHNAIFPTGLTRFEALQMAHDRMKRGVHAFLYDARNGRASWL